MSTSRNKDGGVEQKEGPDQGSEILFTFVTIGDTTWRLFVPSVGLMLIGIWLDQILGTKPWLMIVGLVLGVVVAILLVKQQLTKKV